MMKKVFLSLLLAIACVPVAFSQKAGTVVTVDTTVCSSFHWDVNDSVYSASTVDLYTDVLTSTSYVLNLTVLPANYDTTNVIPVSSNSCHATWNGQEFNEGGEHLVTLVDANGCDSVVKINVILSGHDTIDAVATACDFYQAPWGDTLTASVSYTNQTIVRNGCTYLVTLDLTINHNDTVNEAVTAGCTYTWNNEVITDTNVHTQSFTNAAGCDSLVNLTVTFTGISYVDSNVVACDSYTFGTETITADTTFVVEDSTDICHTFTTYHVTIVPSYRDTANAVIQDTIGGCEIVWGGTSYRYNSVGDTIFANIQSVNGCDSIAGIHIIAFDSTQYSTINSLLDTCYDYTFKYQTLVNGRATNHYTTFTEDGTYTNALNGDPLMTYNNARKCKTYVTLNLTLVQPEQRFRADVVDTACDRFMLDFNNSTNNVNYDGPLTFTETIDDTIVSPTHYNGIICYDSIVHVNLVINKKSYEDLNITSCDTYTWPANNNVYTESTTAEVKNEVKNHLGCDSINRLQLTINHTPQAHIEGVFDQYQEPPYEATLLRAVYEGTESVTFKWYVNNVMTSTDDSCIVDAPTPDNNGVYHNTDVRLETTSQHGCTGSNWITLTYNVGIDEVDGLQVNIYPNPASRFLNIESAEGIREVVVYNAIGQQVIVRNINAASTQLDLGSLAIGNYTLRIVSQNGTETARKFIVNK